MKNKNFKIWLRRNGLLCRKYKYTVPTKPRISHTIYPTDEGKQYDSKGNEFYGTSTIPVFTHDYENRLMPIPDGEFEIINVGTLVVKNGRGVIFDAEKK